MSRNEELEKKLLALPGGQEFKEVVDRLNAADINNRISQLQKLLAESEEHKEQNEALKQARAEVSELAGPYRDVKKAVAIKTKYLVELAKEKGN